MEVLNIKFRKYMLCILCIITMIVPLTKQAEAQTIVDCPESYWQISGPTCIPVYTDVTMLACIGTSVGAASFAVLAVEAILIAFALHFIWVEKMVFPEITRALGKMAEQITAGYMKQAEKMGEYVDAEMANEVMYRIQKNKINGIIANTPSEELCKMATMKASLVAADNAGKIEVWSNLSFLKSEAMSNSTSLSATVNGQSYIMDAMCRYSDRNASVNSFSELCSGIDPDEKYAGKFLLASYVHEPSIADDAREPVNTAMLSMFFNDPVPMVSKETMELNDMKLAYMDHRSVLSRELLNTYCFQRTFEDKLGGTPMSSYQREALINMGLSEEYITNKLGDNPSAYTQKKLITDLALSPDLGVELVEGEENILRLSHVIQSHKMINLYDTLEILHCNELILSQLLNDKLRPKRDDLQERFDTILARGTPKNKDIDYVNNIIGYKELGEVVEATQ